MDHATKDGTASDSSSSRRIPRSQLILRHSLLALAYVLLAILFTRPEVILMTRLGTTLWYPPTGLGFAVMLAINPWYGLLMFLSGLIAGIISYHQPLASWATLGDLLETAVYCGAAILLCGPLRIQTNLNHRRHVVRYALVTLTAAGTAALLGAWCLVADHSIPSDQFWTATFNWYGGDAIALFSVAPFFLIHVFPPVRRWLSGVPVRDALARRSKPTVVHQGARLAETIAQGASLPIVLWFMFGRIFAPLQLYYLSFLPVLWMALRQGIRRVAVGILLLNFGFVVALHVSAQGSDLFFRLSLLMLVVSFAGLIVGSEVSERYRISEDLREQTDYLNSLIENSPTGIVVLDRAARVQLCNEAFERLFLLRRAELVGSYLDLRVSSAHPPELGSLPLAEILAGRSVQGVVRCLRHDGKALDLELSAVPLVRGGQVDGAYALYKDISEQIEAQSKDREHAESLKRWVEELQLRTAEMTALNEMGDLLQCCNSTAEAYTVVPRAAQKLFPRTTSGLLLEFKASRNMLESVSAWGEDHDSEQVFAPDACWALRRGQPHWSGVTGVACPHIKDSAMPALCVPMMAQGEATGLLHLQFSADAFSTQNDHHDTIRQDQQRLAGAMAGQVALSIASLKLQEKLRDQSIRDPLTGLFNRRFMHESLDRELVRAHRKSQPVAVIFLDVDHFKSFNDDFGHDAGDVVLQSLAGLFRNHFRADDIICRYGGEEFTVILPESAAADAGKRADLLLEEVRSLKVLHRDRLLASVTISGGVAAFPEHASTAEELLNAADQCLYRAKNQGRDRVVVASLEKGASTS